MEETRRILNLLEEGKIDSAQAEKLIAAINTKKPQTINAVTPSYLCVNVSPKHEKGERVNVKVPLKVIKAGMKLGALMPESVKSHTQQALSEKGFNIDLNDLNAENVDEFLQALGDLTVDVETEKENVKVFCC